MDFGALPPEINSARMYAGAGATPMLTVAAAWNGIAAELGTTASSFQTVVTRLVSDEWMGPASLAMAAAAQPFLAWLTYTAESSEVAAAQAMASAAAYEAAFAMTVPPTEVAANRAQFAALMANNIFGQNVAAIAATEARYSEMWAQDAAAMYEYASSSALAARLNPLSSPEEVANPAGLANQAAAVAAAPASASAEQVALSALISNGPDAVMSLAAPAAVETTPTNLLQLAAWFDSTELWWVEPLNHQRATYWDYSVGQLGNGGGDEERDVEGEVDLRLAPPVEFLPDLAQSVTPAAAGSTQLVAAVGNATAVGGLSVPASWSMAAPAVRASAAAEGTGWAVPRGGDEVDDGVPLAPGLVADGGEADFRTAPRYGVKPIVMPKQGF